MKLASRRSSYSKLNTIPTLETCDEEPSCYDNNRNRTDTNSTADTNNNNNSKQATRYPPNNRRILRNKTKSHENYGSIEKVSKSFEDRALSR